MIGFQFKQNKEPRGVITFTAFFNFGFTCFVAYPSPIGNLLENYQTILI